MPIPLDDLCRNKAAIMERAIRRIHQEFQADPTLQNLTHLDAMTLNIERACQAAIDLAMHLVARHHLGIPQTSSEAFLLLHKSGFLSETMTKEMTAMTGFRNLAIHEYQALDQTVLRAVATVKWNSFVSFCLELGISIKP
jgi:uncharacterized protein YutE (UPF0331/DUF86 family)